MILGIQRGVLDADKDTIVVLYTPYEIPGNDHIQII